MPYQLRKRIRISQASDKAPDQYPPVDILFISLCSPYLIASHVLSATGATGTLRDHVRTALIPTIPWVIGLVMPIAPSP